MERIFEYQITAAEEGRKIGDFLREKGYSRHLLRQLKETEDGLLRNAQPTFTTVALKAGDRIRVCLLEKAEGSEAIMPAPLPFEIVYEDEDLLVVNKPADMPIHPSFQNHGNTLADALTWHYQQHREDFVYRCINRLDRDTTGLLIVAKHLLSASILSDMVGKREIHREYLAIVKGIPPENGTISATIGRKKGSAILREVNFETGEAAVTHFARLEIRMVFLASLKLETGGLIRSGFIWYRLSPDRRLSLLSRVQRSAARRSTPPPFLSSSHTGKALSLPLQASEWIWKRPLWS